jgi:oxygen-dependent protoporphyrinogen oxidase
VALDLRDAIGLHAPLVDAHVMRWGGGLPQYAVGHVERVRRIRAAVAEVPGLEVCGAAFNGLGIPAVIADADAAVTRLLDDLVGPEQ